MLVGEAILLKHLSVATASRQKQCQKHGVN